MKDIKFYLDQPGVQEVIYVTNTKVTNLERDVMERTLAQVNASFIQEFGTEGTFEIQFVRQKIGGRGASYVNGTRPVFRIRAANPKTGAILKAHPGWLAKFARDAKL